jgi:hypothetical protein
MDLRDQSTDMDLETRLLTMAGVMAAPRPEQLTSETSDAERALRVYIRQAWHVLHPTERYIEAWHVGCIAEHLQALTELQIRNLVINIPPGHAKSVTACVLWPTWVWVRTPEARWLFGSYAESLSFRDAEKARSVITSPWYQARWGHIYRLRHNQNAKGFYSNDRTGYRVSTTVGGKNLGQRVDYAVWDDPHNAKEVNSDVIRGEVLRVWREAITLRAANPAFYRKLVIMQRLHQRDLSGHCLEELGGYEHLCLPAEYEPKRYWFPPRDAGGDGAALMEKPRDAIVPTALQRARPELLDGPTGSGRTNAGDPLFPQYYDSAKLEELAAGLQAVGRAGQLQQRPNPTQGSVYRAEYFHPFHVRPGPDGPIAVLGDETAGDGRALVVPVRLLRFFQIVDTSLTADARSAFTVVGTFGWNAPTADLLVWDVWRHRLEVGEQFEALKQLREGMGRFDPNSRQWVLPGRALPWPGQIMFQGVEDVPGSKGLIQSSRASGRPLRPIKPAGRDKVQRAAQIVGLYAAGKVWHKAGAGWRVDLEEELLAFPRGAYKDQADVMAYAGQVVDTEVILNANPDGDAVLWPPPARDAAGNSMADPGDDSRQVVNVGGVTVEFNEEGDPWR